jgi:hypothetical protein
MAQIMEILTQDMHDAVRIKDLKASDEAERIQADLLRNVDKGRRLAAVNDAHAMDLQIQFQGCIGGLPA